MNSAYSDFVYGVAKVYTVTVYAGTVDTEGIAGSVYGVYGVLDIHPIYFPVCA